MSLLDQYENVSNDLRNSFPDLPTSFANPRRGSALCFISAYENISFLIKLPIRNISLNKFTGRAPNSDSN